MKRYVHGFHLSIYLLFMLIFIHFDFQMVAHHSNYINDRVRQIITGRNFFDDLKILAFVLSPIRETVLALEGKKATLGDCFFYMVRLGAAIKKLPRRYNISFYNHCVLKMNTRFKEFDDDKYLLGFFLSPQFRGIFCFIYQILIIILQNLN